MAAREATMETVLICCNMSPFHKLSAQRENGRDLIDQADLMCLF